MPTIPTERAKHKRRWFQISLRSLLRGTLAISLVLGLLVRERHKGRLEREAIAVLTQKGCYVDYHVLATPAPDWYCIFLGGDPNQQVVLENTMHAENFDDDDLALIGRLKGLKVLYLLHGRVTDDGLVHLRGLSDLKELCLSGNNVTNTGLVHLRGLTQMKRLDLMRTSVTQSGVDELRQTLPNVEMNWQSTGR